MATAVCRESIKLGRGIFCEHGNCIGACSLCDAAAPDDAPAADVNAPKCENCGAVAARDLNLWGRQDGKWAPRRIIVCLRCERSLTDGASGNYSSKPLKW